MTRQMDGNVQRMDYVLNNTLHHGYRYNSNVQVQSADDLEAIAEYYCPGAFAHTPGWGNIWELNGAGSWIEVPQLVGLMQAMALLSTD